MLGLFFRLTHPLTKLRDPLLPIGFGNVGLDEGTAELPEVVDHQIDCDVVQMFGDTPGHGLRTHCGDPNPNSPGRAVPRQSDGCGCRGQAAIAAIVPRVLPAGFIDPPAASRRHRPFYANAGNLSPLLPQSTGVSIETERQNRRLAYVTRWLVDAA
jgi:hypothetical protein